jgi:hypothetical protein
MRSIILSAATALLMTGSVSAADAPATTIDWIPPSAKNVWHVCWLDPCDVTVEAAPAGHLQLPAGTELDDSASQPSRPVAIEYSDGYQLRRKIHRYASFATLPLFAAEYALGQSMYSTTPSDTSSKRGLHAAIGVGIIGLFGVNTVTGAWNLFGEGRKDPNRRTLRLIHGLLMMAADVGFVATTQSGPNSRSQRQALTYETDKVTHRNIAIASISVGTAGYLLMLFGNR